MTRYYESRDRFLEQADWHAREMEKMRRAVLNLAVVVDRVNTRGYYDRLLQQTELDTGVGPEKIAEERAKKAERAAAYRAQRERNA
jgi:hypothetical protein